MGNYRFRLSDMIPNAWFYKLRDMSKTKPPSTTLNHHKKPPHNSYNYHSSSSTTSAPLQNHHFSQPRNSLYHTPRASHFHNSPHFHDPPRKSSKRLTPNRKTIYKPSPKHISLTESTHSLQDHFFHSPSSESTHSELTYNKQLPPIITKPAKLNSGDRIPARKSASGVKFKLRVNSPRVALGKRITGTQKGAQRKIKDLNESFAVVKSSFDPQKDFRESMMEMIVENNIRESKGLEELLACYLSLNSDEYHDVIVKAFEQIWFSLSDR